MNNIQKKIDSLRKDPVMEVIINDIGDLPPLKAINKTPFQYLIHVIISQQLSSASANAIIAKFVNNFSDNFTAEQLLECGENSLRICGISSQKARYIQAIAQAEAEGKLQPEKLEAQNNSDVIAELTAIKGVGVWTAKMFLLFYVQRDNILPIEDLVIRTQIQNLYNTDGSRPIKKIIEELDNLWQPYQSYASRYLWQWNDRNKKKSS